MKKRTKKTLIIVAVMATLLLLPLQSAFAVSGDDFTDVAPSHWAKQFVDFVVDKGYFNGTSATTFTPSGNMTRAMFVTVIARVEGVQVNNMAANKFSDVPMGKYYTGSVVWANENGIVNGTGEKTFSPNRAISRQDICTLLDRYIKYVEKNHDKKHRTIVADANFKDKGDIAAYAQDAVTACVKYGLITGYPDNTFLPKKTATRAEVAAIIYRLAFLMDGKALPGTAEITVYDVDGDPQPTVIVDTTKKETFTIPDALKKDGYTFTEWNTAKDGKSRGYQPGEVITPTESLSLYPIFKENVVDTAVTVTFDANGGDGKMDPQTITASKATALSANAFTREHYTFTGWNTAKDGKGDAYADKAEITLAANATLFAQWQAKEYTMTFDSDGGSPLAPITAPYDSEIKQPADPTKAGHTFDGWDPAFPEKMNGGDIVLKAKWKINQYTVKFVDEGGAELSSAKYDYGTEAKDVVKPADPTKAATAQYTYTFAGWDKDIVDVTADATYTATYKESLNQYTVKFVDEGGVELSSEKYDYGTDAKDVVKPADPSKAATAQYTYTFAGWDKDIVDVTADVTYTATYKETVNRYNVTFVDEDDTVLKTATAYDYGTEPGDIAKPATPEKASTAEAFYTFAGWTPEVTKVTKDVTYKATYSETKKSYTIFFDTAGGNKITPITLECGAAIKVDDPTKTGHTFDGWDPALPATMPANNLSVTAQWTVNQYTITFDSDGGTEINAITQDYGSDVTAPADPTREGYTFKGWDPAIPAKMPAKDTGVKAQWEINQYTITFDTDGGSEIDAITQDYGSDVTAPADPTREGHTFAGWDKTIPATMPAEDVTIKATWTKNEFTVKFDLGDATAYFDAIADQTVKYEEKATAPVAGDLKAQRGLATSGSGKTMADRYEFLGWFADKAATTPFKFDEKAITEDTTVYAGWKVKKFRLEVESGAAVVGTVYDDYNAKLTIDKGNVNAANVNVTADMWQVQSLGVDGVKGHSLTVDTGMTGSYALNNYLSVPDGFTSNVTAHYYDKDPADGGSELVTAVDYALSAEDTADAVIVKGTTDTEKARAMWQALFSDENVVSGANPKGDDSYATIKNGSWLQIGTDKLMFEPTVKNDLILDNFSDLNALEQNIKDHVTLKTNVGTDDEIIAFVLKKGTNLAVSSSYVELQKDAHVVITGLPLNDASIDYSVLGDLRSATGKKDLVNRLVSLVDLAIDNANGKDIDVNIWFEESSEYTVNFDLGAAADSFKAIADQTVEGGEYAANVGDPVAADGLPVSGSGKTMADRYEFLGWFTDKNGTDKFKFDEKAITEDTTVYAGWKVKKFRLEVESGAAVTGTVYDDYNAKLTIDKGNVNAAGVNVTADMWQVQRLGVDGVKGHKISVDTGMTGEYALSSYLSVPDGFRSNVTAHYYDKDPDKGGTETVAAVDYALDADDTTADAVIVKGTTDTEKARAMWQALFSDENVVSGANPKGDDSYATIKNGSWLQIGTDKLMFEPTVKDDLVLDNFSDLDALEQNIKDHVTLKTGVGTDDETIAFVLKKGTNLAVSSSYVELLKDAHVEITGLPLNDAAAGYSALEELRDANGQKDLVKRVIALIDRAIDNADGKDIAVKIWFEEPQAPETNFIFSVKSGSEVKATCFSDYSATVDIVAADENATVTSDKVTLYAEMTDVPGLGVTDKRSHSIDVATGLAAQTYKLKSYLSGMYSFRPATVTVNYDGKSAQYDVFEDAKDGGNVTIKAAPVSEKIAGELWRALISEDNFATRTKSDDDSFFLIKEGAYFDTGKGERLQFEANAGDLKLDGFNDLEALKNEIKAHVELDTTVAEGDLSFFVPKATVLAVGSSEAELKKDAKVTISGIDPTAINGDELQNLRTAASGDTKALIANIITLVNNCVVTGVSGQNVTIDIEMD